MSNTISGLRILPAELERTGSSQAPGSKFAESLRDAMDDVTELQQQAEGKVAGMLQGDGVDVHSALIAVEKADLSFQLMMQVRNKIVAAYQQISNMQF